MTDQSFSLFVVDRDAVWIALNFLDRASNYWVRESEGIIKKREIQLLAVTSLYMAIKIHGQMASANGPHRKLKIDLFCELSRKQFDVKHIEETERYILTALNWNVNPPSAVKFIATFLSLCPKWDTSVHNQSASVLGAIYDVSRYLSELSVCQSDFSFSCKTSVVAFSCIVLAIEFLQATLPLPYDVRVAFLNNIAVATGLASGNAEVLCVVQMLKEIAPDMVASEEIHDVCPDNNRAVTVDDLSEDGKVSPVCVIAEQSQDHELARKRVRSSDMDNSLSIPRHADL
jgi:Cyclin, N-terminal domain